MAIPVLPLDPGAADGRRTTPPSGPFTWQTFYGFRNAVLDTLRPFGSVGPMGATPIVPGPAIPERAWPLEAEQPTFYVLDDWWFEEQMFVRIELAPQHFTAPVLDALTNTLVRHPGWAVALAFIHKNELRGYLLVFSDRVMRRGRLFWLKRTTAELLATCARFKEHGAA